MVFSDLDRAVLFTLTYSAQFSYPLTASEVWQRLLFQLDDDHLLLSQSVSVAQVKTSLKKLTDAKLVGESRSFFWPVSVNGKAVVAARQRRELIAQHKWHEVASLVKVLEKISWIKAVYVTGSLAVNNTEVDDDSDFMIVVAARRLWLTRLLVLLWAMIKGKRRSWHGEEKKSWCFNMWLEESEVGVFSGRQTVYTAYELQQMKPVSDSGGVTAALFERNQWVKTYLLQGWSRGEEKKNEADEGGFSGGALGANLFLSALNYIAFLLQYLYMYRHMTREWVGQRVAFFHPRPTRRSIYHRWLDQIQNLTSS